MTDAPAEKPKLKVGVPKEVVALERRVAATPQTVTKLRKMGLDVLVQAGAGDAASYADAAYAEAGATIVTTASEIWAAADLVLKVRGPTDHPEMEQHEADVMREGQALVSFIWPAQNPELLAKLAEHHATVLAMDCVPRITRAQKLDALSATANVAGYKAVVEAANAYARPLGGQITAAGRIPPAKVLVLGAGVAGLAAIGAARSLGAVVRAFDTRPVVREQVESLGATFVPFEFEGETGEGAGGYAKEVSEAYLAAEHALIAQQCEDADIVITTALVPGKRAPLLITSGAVVGMHAGSVIVDLAAEQGGNCALTERDRSVVKFGVTILGYTDLASRMAAQTSELYATTVLRLLEEVLENGQLALDLDDEVHRGMLVVHDGKITWPPPRPQQRSGAPVPPKPVAAKHEKPAPKPESPWPLRIALALAVAALVPLALFAPSELVEHITVFALACVVGWHVVWNVTPALHTPLMSVTNAISGIILLGGLLVVPGHASIVVTALAATAVLLATINVAGGFLVTQRMLKMFRR